MATRFANITLLLNFAKPDEYGDTVCKHYVASELRQAVNSMFRNDNDIIEACKNENGFTYSEM